jgi:putative PIN family toxin of toxin-antitoxin system
MRICLDTNVLVQLFTRRSPFNEIREALLQGQITLIHSNEILFEYEEVITNELGLERWRLLGAFFESLGRAHGNVLEIVPSYRFGIVQTDLDDNKFTDCAVTGEAEYVVTYDRHFDALAGAGYRPQVITPEELVERLRSKQTGG